MPVLTLTATGDDPIRAQQNGRWVVRMTNLRV
jgi:hypothetical protein